MTHPTFRRHRSHADDDQDATEHLQAIRPADWDGTTITWTGAGAGLPPDEFYAGDDPAAGLRQAIEMTALAERGPGPGTGPARLRVMPPPPAPPPPLQVVPAAGYTADATGPLPAIGRERPAIGDALAHDEQWGPGLAPLPCGHCGISPDIPAGVLERTRIIGYVNHRAWEAGWTYDADLIWTCPGCQAGEAWKARQGPVEVYRSHDCRRHAYGHDGDCTCPGAVLAVDAMLASQDYLGRSRAGGAR